MKPQNVESVYQLSPLQEGLLFHALYQPDDTLYVLQLSFTFRGPLDVASLRRAWQLTLENHAVLRTAFQWRDLQKPVQVVFRQVALPWCEHDWRHLSEAEQKTCWRDLQEQDAQQGFDLEHAPLVRLSLVKTSMLEHRLVWSFHHILIDGWCLPLLFREVFTTYHQLCRGEEPRPTPSRPYKDYIAWLRRQDPAPAEAFWRGYLEGLKGPTPLAMGSQRPDAPAGHEERSERLPAAATLRLVRWASQQRLTVNTMLVGAWALLLSRYSGEREVVFGTTFSGRSAPLPGIESMVGLFINTLPARVVVEGSSQAGSWLRALQDAQAAARQHEHTPLVDVQSWVGLPGGQPLFESILVFENYPFDDVAGLSGSGGDTLQVEVEPREGGINYPLSLAVFEGEQIELRLSFELRRLCPTDVARLLGQLRRLLVGLVEDPTTRLDTLDLLTSPERHQLRVEWSQTPQPAPQSGRAAAGCLHELVEIQAGRSPEAIAVVHEDAALSYGELDRRADLWADRLGRLGIQPEAVVGVLMERSLEAIVALLSVLKAGGAYLPLDPSLPQERLVFMAADARAELLLTDPRVREELAGTELRMEVPDLGWSTGSAEGGPRRAQPGHRAWVIYTSGSTGRPKGVEVEHRSAVRHFGAMQAIFQLSPLDRALQFASLSFDISLEQIFTALAFGAQLLLRPERLGTEEEFLDWTVLQRLTVADLPPALWAGLARECGDQPERHAANPLRLLIVGGDVMPASSIEPWQRWGGGRTLLNGYGPTETTITATLYEIPASHGDPRRRVAIGRPVGARFVSLQDRRGMPVPIGAIGELLVGGRCLARGYLGRPAVTARAFVPDSLGPEPGGRLYRTGDLARFLPDGALDFVGRIDHQVKIRGFRIELGEIETALSRQPGVHEVVVVAREEASGDRRLVAYVVPAAAPAPSPAGLRGALRQILPEHMVPAVILMLEALPRTNNGKIDRGALPAVEPENTGSLTPPRTVVEEILCGIWAEVLNRDTIGTRDDFFALGGHSLLATRVISRLPGAFKIELPVRALFDSPTVAGLAAVIERQMRADRGLEPPLLERVSRSAELPLSFAQQRLWFIDQLEPGSSAYNIPTALRLVGALDVAALTTAFTEVVRRHEPLRTSFPALETGPVQRIAPPSLLSLPVADLQALPTSERALEAKRLASAEAGRAFDLARGPMLRVGLLRLGPEDHVLLVTMHHIASDGWSMAILTREVVTLYEAFSAGRPSPLLSFGAQYADYAVWQRRWLSGAVLAGELDFWRRHLGGEPPALQLPYDRPSPARPTSTGAQRSFPLPSALSLAVLAWSRAESVTPFMTLLSVFAVLLARRAGQRSLVVGMPIAGRSRLDLEGMIGFFINILPLRIELGSTASFRALVGHIREITLAALSHQDLPLEKLVEELRPERQADASPLFQVTFGALNEPREEARVPGLEILPFPLSHETVRFHLTVWVFQTENDLVLQWTFNTDLFEEPTIVLLHRQFEALLSGALANPRAEIDELELLGESEREEKARSRELREASRYQRLKVSKPKGLHLAQPHK